MFVSAHYPNQVWNGLSKNTWRTTRQKFIDPDPHDWDQISAEMIATQTHLDAVAAKVSVTETLWVDGNRTDTYTETGSILKPFKTMQAAITVASGNVLINVAPGTYNGDMNLGLHVTTIRGSGLNATMFTGNMIAGDRAHTLEDFRIKITGSLTMTDSVTAYRLHLQGAVVVSGTGSFDAHNVLIAPSSGVVPLTMSSTGQCILSQGYISAIGDVNAINQTDGTVIAYHSYMANNSLIATTVNSTGGVCGLIDSGAFNSGFGSAVNLDNSGSALSTNTISGGLFAGNVACGAAHTIVEGLNFLGFGSLTGTNLIYRPASRLANDSTIVGDTIEDALNTLGQDVPVTKVLWVDGNRIDTYTEDGSIQKPYKTIQAAVAAASGDVLINVAPGTYTGDIDLGLHVTTVRGSGLNATIFTGNITAGDRAHTLKSFRLTSAGSLTITDNVTVFDADLRGPVTVTATGFLEGRSIRITTESGVTPLTTDSSCILFDAHITSDGDADAIKHTDGSLVIFHSFVRNKSFAHIAVNSSGSSCGVIDTTVINLFMGTAINLDNNSTVEGPNSLDGVICGGDIICGAAPTRAGDPNFIGFGELTGTGLIYRPASRLANDSIVAGDTIKNALDTLGHVPDPVSLADNEYVLSVTGGVATWVIKT